MNRFETFEEICKEEKIDWAKMEAIYNQLPNLERDEAVYNAQQNIIIRALNKQDNGGKEWKPNYNTLEPKYVILWDVIADEMRPSGSGLSYHDYVYGSTLTHVGARRVFRSVPLVKHAAKYFNQYFVNDLLYKY